MDKLRNINSLNLIIRDATYVIIRTRIFLPIQKFNTGNIDNKIQRMIHTLIYQVIMIAAGGTKSPTKISSWFQSWILR